MAILHIDSEREIDGQKEEFIEQEHINGEPREEYAYHQHDEGKGILPARLSGQKQLIVIDSPDKEHASADKAELIDYLNQRAMGGSAADAALGNALPEEKKPDIIRKRIIVVKPELVAMSGEA